MFRRPVRSISAKAPRRGGPAVLWPVDRSATLRVDSNQSHTAAGE